MFAEISASGLFYAFGPAHLSVLVLTTLVAALMILVTRKGWLRATRGFEVALAVMLFMEWPLNLMVAWHFESISAGNALPFQFCDVAAIIGALALLTHHAELCELLYFWGLAGTMQGLITPALNVDWPHPRFVTFFILHAGVVMAAIHLVFARGHTPRQGAVARAIGWLIVYAAFAGAANAVINACGGDANYGFLCNKPPTASLFDFLGPWPWYIGSVAAMAWLLFTVLDLPFLMARRKTR
ncbi:MAG: TIGR02206 family membrane protein [Verrucomicrobiaceae bacterium]